MESMLIMGVVIILKHFVPKIDMWGMVQGDFRVMKKRKRSRIIWTVLFWMIFLVSVATIVYLSFQNGTSSAELGSDVIEKLAAEYYERTPFQRQSSISSLTISGRWGERLRSSSLVF